jgi:hypothetical protein
MIMLTFCARSIQKSPIWKDRSNSPARLTKWPDVVEMKYPEFSSGRSRTFWIWPEHWIDPMTRSVSLRVVLVILLLGVVADSLIILGGRTEMSILATSRPRQVKDWESKISFLLQHFFTPFKDPADFAKRITNTMSDTKTFDIFYFGSFRFPGWKLLNLA